MGLDKRRVDKIKQLREIEEESSIFDSDDLGVEDHTDEYLRLRNFRKSPALFRAMVVHPDFPLKPGQRLSARSYGDGYADENGVLHGSDGKVYSSLSLFARGFMPEVETVDKRDQIKRVANPDGWDSIFAHFNDERIMLSDLFYDNWQTLGMEISVLEDSELLIAEMERLGYGGPFQDLKRKTPRSRKKPKTSDKRDVDKANIKSKSDREGMSKPSRPDGK